MSVVGAHIFQQEAGKASVLNVVSSSQQLTWMPNSQSWSRYWWARSEVGLIWAQFLWEIQSRSVGARTRVYICISGARLVEKEDGTWGIVGQRPLNGLQNCNRNEGLVFVCRLWTIRARDMDSGGFDEDSRLGRAIGFHDSFFVVFGRSRRRTSSEKRSDWFSCQLQRGERLWHMWPWLDSSMSKISNAECEGKMTLNSWMHGRIVPTNSRERLSRQSLSNKGDIEERLDYQNYFRNRFSTFYECEIQLRIFKNKCRPLFLINGPKE